MQKNINYICIHKSGVLFVYLIGFQLLRHKQFATFPNNTPINQRLNYNYQISEKTSFLRRTHVGLVVVGDELVWLRALAGGEGVLPVAELPFRG